MKLSQLICIFVLLVVGSASAELTRDADGKRDNDKRQWTAIYDFFKDAWG